VEQSQHTAKPEQRQVYWSTIGITYLMRTTNSAINAEVYNRSEHNLGINSSELKVNGDVFPSESYLQEQQCDPIPCSAYS
jgi:hypothetical protein